MIEMKNDWNRNFLFFCCFEKLSSIRPLSLNILTYFQLNLIIHGNEDYLCVQNAREVSMLNLFIRISHTIIVNNLSTHNQQKTTMRRIRRILRFFSEFIFQLLAMLLRRFYHSSNESFTSKRNVHRIEERQMKRDERKSTENILAHRIFLNF